MPTTENSLTIHNYQQTFIPCYNASGELRIAIRNYEVNNVSCFLTVNPYTFATESLPVTAYNSRKPTPTGQKPGYFTCQEFNNTPYLKALNYYTQQPVAIQNHGIKHAEYPIEGVFLTIDMCPSVKPFEAEFFQALLSPTDHPTPIAICMSGFWLLKHEENFNWLIEQQKNNKLNITWVNHSFSHLYYADDELNTSQGFSQNFLCAPRTNLNLELLEVERLLLKNGQLPSVFFRAPGLVMNDNLASKLNEYGLIPLGSDAWLAKNEEPTDGSIILVHGNSNEPDGIKAVMPMIQSQRFRFFPLSKALLPPDEEKSSLEHLPKVNTL